LQRNGTTRYIIIVIILGGGSGRDLSTTKDNTVDSASLGTTVTQLQLVSGDGEERSCFSKSGLYHLHKEGSSPADKHAARFNIRESEKQENIQIVFFLTSVARATWNEVLMVFDSA
jgi:hypothetical protein